MGATSFSPLAASSVKNSIAKRAEACSFFLPAPVVAEILQGAGAFAKPEGSYKAKSARRLPTQNENFLLEFKCSWAGALPSPKERRHLLPIRITFTIMFEAQTKKVFSVHRIIGRYEVEGTITFMPAPPPGLPTELVKVMIDEQVEDMVKARMLEDMFAT